MPSRAALRFQHFTFPVDSSTMHGLIVLADDGTLWENYSSSETRNWLGWMQIPNLPPIEGGAF